MREQRCGGAIDLVAWIHKKSAVVRSFQDHLPKREKKREKGTMIVCGSEEVYEEKGVPCGSCPSGYYYETPRVPRSATYVQRHSPMTTTRTTTKITHFSTAARPLEPRYIKNASYFGGRDRIKRSLSRYRLLERSRRNLTLLILEESLLIRQEQNIINNEDAKSNKKL